MIAMIATLAGNASPATAYLPDPVHDRLARAAIATFNDCVRGGHATAGAPERYRIVTDAEAELIVAADVDEDQRHLLRRGWNWHFYSEQVRPLWYLGMDRTLNRVFDQIATALEGGRLDGDEECRQTGRAMHFLEDLTVPAHVVPVYHGLFVSDPVDGYEAGGLATRIAERMPGACRALAKRGAMSSPRALLDDTARATTARLDASICGDGAPTWHVFWEKPLDGAFFGSYAPHAFGVETELAGCAVTREIYDRFVLDGHLDAVLADVALLFRTRRTPPPAR